MQLARNLIANGLNQAASFLLNIVAVPIYLSLVGIEQYALVGLGLLVQMWVSLLDLGMSGTLGREMTRLKIGDEGQLSVLSFLRSLDWLFLGSIVLLTVLGYLTRNWWSEYWLTKETLPKEMVGQAAALIISLSAVRVAGTLYRGGVLGLERQVLASAIGIVASVARLIAPLPVMWIVPDIRILFAFWLVISLVELAALRLILSRAFSASLPWRHFSLAALRKRGRLWGSMAFLALIWTLITQGDKIILSRVLPLAEFGQFTLVTVLSNAILAIPLPIVVAYQPRFLAAAAAGDRAELGRLVHDATRLIMLTTIAPALAMAAAPEATVFAWTGNAEAAAAVSSYLGLYVLGSAVVGLASILYGIQVAYGELSLHVKANCLLAGVLVPAVFFAASSYGALGAATVWLAMNVALLVGYFPLVLRRFLPSEAGRWYAVSIAPPALATGLAAVALTWLLPDDYASRGGALAAAAASAMLVCGVALLALLLVKRLSPR